MPEKPNRLAEADVGLTSKLFTCSFVKTRPKAVSAEIAS